MQTGVLDLLVIGLAFPLYPLNLQFWIANKNRKHENEIKLIAKDS